MLPELFTHANMRKQLLENSIKWGGDREGLESWDITSGLSNELPHWFKLGSFEDWHTYENERKNKRFITNNCQWDQSICFDHILS